MSAICGIDHHRRAMIDGSRTFQRSDRRIPYSSRRIATFDDSRGFQPTEINATCASRRGATVDPVASCGVANGFMGRSATRSLFRDMIRGLKPTATIMRSLRDGEGMPRHRVMVDTGVIPGRGATSDGSRTLKRADHRVLHSLRRGATFDGSRGFQPTEINAPYSSRRGATVDPVASCGVAHGFMRRSATRSLFRDMIRGLKPTATIMRSLRDGEGMPMTADERVRRMEMNLEGLGG